MAIAVGVTSKGRSGSAASIATTGVTTQASGSTFVVGVLWGAAFNFTSLVDSKSNSYTQIGSEIAFDTAKSRFYYCQNGTGGASHTATLTVTGGVACDIFFLEITGGLTTGILDKSNGRADASSPFTLASGLTTTQANELLVTFLACNSGSNPATHAESGLGSSTIQTGAEETNGASFWTGALATAIKSSTGTFNPSWTESGGTSSSAWLATFKAASASTSPATLGAWLTRPVLRRRELKRVVVTPPAMQWKYIAPTVAAVLPRAKVIRIDHRRKPVRDRPLIFAAPPTGPPSHVAWAAVTVKRVSHRKWLVAPRAQASYPATPPSTQPPATYTPKRVSHRKWLVVPVALASYPATPAVTTVPAAPQALRTKFGRRFIAAAPQLLFPATPAAATYPGMPAGGPFVTWLTKSRRLLKVSGLVSASAVAPQAPASAVALKRIKRRKSRAGLFLTGAPAVSQLPTVTEALFPAFVPPRTNRVVHKRKLLSLPPTLVRVADAAPQAPAQAGGPFVTRLTKSRRLLTLAAPIGVNPAPPTPATLGAVTLIRAKWRKELRRVLVPQFALLEYPETEDDQGEDEDDQGWFYGKRKKQLFVEIDGQTFPVASEQQAVQLLEQAKSIAETQALQKASIAEKRLRSKPTVPVVKIPAPVITVSAPLKEATAPLIADIKDLYKDAAQAAEIRLLLQKQQDEDDDDVLLLL